VVVKQDEHRIVLFRQIAGFVARRIVCYAKVGMEVKQGDEMGMIKFGSRVDVFLPPDVQVAVQVGDKVRSKKTVLAYF
jgi:phosphatidylserine decarboxylase